MDVGDTAGDLYFLLRSVVSPIECAQDPGAEDCTDTEVISSSLVATQLSMTVDSDYGPYGHCNICNKALMNTSWTKPYCNMTNLGEYFCIGYNLSTGKVGFETVAANHPQTCFANNTEWQCWQNRVVTKIGGNWWSFFKESFNKSWKVDAVESVINNTCLQAAVYTAIEGYKPTRKCFARCRGGGGHAARNTSDPCWVGCVFDAVLGPGAGYSNGSVTGMPVSALTAAWEGAFGPKGCPQVPLPAGESESTRTSRRLQHQQPPALRIQESPAAHYEYSGQR
jgi:hypothetical protein